MNIDYKLIGSRIKLQRNSLGITQEKLAEKLDVSIGYVSQVERGITKISLDLLGKIAGILHCDIALLITGASVLGENYLLDETTAEIVKLDNKKRKIVLEFIKLISEI